MPRRWFQLSRKWESDQVMNLRTTTQRKQNHPALAWVVGGIWPEPGANTTESRDNAGFGISPKHNGSLSGLALGVLATPLENATTDPTRMCQVSVGGLPAARGDPPHAPGTHVRVGFVHR